MPRARCWSYPMQRGVHRAAPQCPVECPRNHVGSREKDPCRHTVTHLNRAIMNAVAPARLCLWRHRSTATALASATFSVWPATHEGLPDGQDLWRPGPPVVKALWG